jgi:hypothetical protein
MPVPSPKLPLALADGALHQVPLFAGHVYEAPAQGTADAGSAEWSRG